jgi:succinylglutamate desuccinylase
MSINPARVVGRYQGAKKGPLLIVIGAMHGNEPAGVNAINLMAKMLEAEPLSNPEFVYSGTFLGLIGNLKAFKQKKRFIKKDMNRMFTQAIISKIANTDIDDLEDEEKEIKELIHLIDEEIKKNISDKVILLDLHTTSSTGGIFSIATDDKKSIEIAVELHAPVITGMLKGLQGTTLHYFTRENLNLDITPVTFESGQHNEDLSVNRAIAAITNCMRTIGSVNGEDVENKHDKILQDYSKSLPKVVTLKQRYAINPEDQFKMNPGYTNFQPIAKGEVLAFDKRGPVKAPYDGRILMPLYQEQGEEGFFIVQDKENY